MTVQRARYAKIERLVSALLLEHRVSKPAVAIQKLVRKMGIEIKYGDLGDVSGLLVRSGATATIGVNISHPLVRQRFTIAHEFGHYLLHLGISSHYDRDYRVNYRSHESSQATDVEEIEANFFAASILMPKEFLDADEAIHALDNDAAVERLATRYNVSRHAMSLRLGNVYGRHRPF
ncbi:Zn-dependent peptidase ImmA (M78 family) [Bradyrhizobium sp. CIR18]|uniref:ImmA/IrrE family metallo-endopeptidase n=1 Tax=Bradyrhizobium sp. CIR18 TaxID=2663839 RepID=UPI001605785E|nr:ImmA/IrrE family metallo-endopeptidase [Bradyrhizobium sp. CIR18]MBB4365012.1 Zn-dependent peptidase ImmA (M78 family) [Bradyrhizobium sp. CIR18]